MFTDLRNRTRVFRCQILDHVQIWGTALRRWGTALMGVGNSSYEGGEKL